LISTYYYTIYYFTIYYRALKGRYNNTIEQQHCRKQNIY